jgi:hypothetical protein
MENLNLPGLLGDVAKDAIRPKNDLSQRTKLLCTPSARPGLDHLLHFLVRFGPSGCDIIAALANGRHQPQLLSNVIERSILREPLERIHNGLLVRHA